ncbi:M15 family metallopeptidase [Clostridium botulinum]|uniref:M15 family metallopeptidase n=1 Tax=Clostridium botulinum TaxID=1491 RepID=UPI003DA5F74C
MKKLGIIIIIALIIFSSMSVYSLLTIFPNNFEMQIGKEQTQIESTSRSKTRNLGDLSLNDSELEINGEVSNIDFTTKSTKDLTIKNNLSLVNYNHIVPKNFTNDIISINGIVPTSKNDMFLNSDMLKAVQSLFKAANEKGYYNYYVNSAYRNAEYQSELYNESQDKSYVAKPGYSEHETGLAVDIGYNQSADNNQGQWLANNAYKYGLILRYPSDKISITQISYESWHFRYVGVVHAQFMKENNLCLEEYIDYLQIHHSYHIPLENGKSYSVFYKKEINNTLDVPKEKNYELSSDNDGGYILTVEE